MMATSFWPHPPDDNFAWPHPQYYAWDENFNPPMPMYVPVNQDGEGPVPSWHDGKPVPSCDICGTRDPDGWKKRDRGGFFCTGCYNLDCNLHCSNDQEMDEEEEMGAEAIPPATWYFWHEIDCLAIHPPHRMKMTIKVEDKCCLQLAQELGKHACLLVHGRQQGPLAEHIAKGQATTVLQSSALRKAVLLTPCTEEGTPRAVPRYGGILVPDVPVTQDSSGQKFETPFSLSMVYAASLRPGEEDVALYDEMETKVKTVLRIMLKQGKDQAILGAWGCGNRGLDPKRMAHIFRSALCEDTSTGNRFRRVVFAIQHKPEHFTVFREVFEDVLSESSLRDRQTVTAV